jgi:hypothetical protein
LKPGERAIVKGGVVLNDRPVRSLSTHFQLGVSLLSASHEILAGCWFS